MTQRIKKQTTVGFNRTRRDLWNLDYYLGDTFVEKIISFYTPQVWETHSPDITLLAIFRQGYWEDNFFVNKPNTILEHKAIVTRQI